MPGGKGNIRSKDGKPFSKDYQPPEKWTKKRAMALGNELIEWLKETDEDGEDKGNMFFEEFLVIEKDLYLEVISYLCKKFTAFSKLIDKAKKIQEIKLVKYGVGDRLNATMTKFVLMNCHGFSDKSSQEVSGKDGDPINISSIQVEVIDKREQIDKE